MNKFLKSIKSSFHYWVLVRRLELKYTVLLTLYIKIFPKKFKIDQYVVFRNDIWRIYHSHKSYRPYYYHLYKASAGRYIYTGVAYEDELKLVPPVIREIL